MPLPPAPSAAINFLMGGPTELVTARAVPSSERLPHGRLRSAAADVRKSIRTYDEIHASGRALLDARAKVHADDERNASRAVGAGKPMPPAKLDDHDAQIADQAERLAAAAGAVINAVHALEAVAPEDWAKAADRTFRQVAEGVGEAEGALVKAREAIEAVDSVAGILAWTKGRPVGRDPRVVQAIDALDRAQERIAVIRDGEAPVDPNLVAPPAHAGMSRAWAEATAPLPIPGT